MNDDAMRSLQKVLISSCFSHHRELCVGHCATLCVARVVVLRMRDVNDVAMRVAASRIHTSLSGISCFFHCAVVNGMQCVSIRDRTDADIRHVSWLGGQQWRNVERRRQRRRKRSSSSFLFSSRSSDLTFRRLRHTGRVASWGDERNAVAPRRPGTDDKRGRRRGFESRRRPRYVWIAEILDALGARSAGRRLEALVARAPILRPLHSLLDLAGGLGLFPFGAAFLQPLARGELTGRRRFLGLGLRLFRRRRLRGLCGCGRREQRQAARRSGRPPARRRTMLWT